MTKTAERILSEAMALDEDEREELAARLMGTLEPSTDPAYVAAWEAEIKKRIEELDSGEVQAIPWEQARLIIRRGGGNVEETP